MRLFASFAMAVLLLAPGPVRAQTSVVFDNGTEVPAGSVAFRVEHTLSAAPQEQDYFRLDLSSSAIHPTVITPDGRRLTQKTASGTELQWRAMPLTPPLGSADRGQELQLVFTRKAAPGRYTFEFDTRTAKAPSRVLLGFTSQQADDSLALSALPGFQRFGPVSFDPAHSTAELTITLPRSTKESVFDTISTNPRATVSLTLPSGEVLNGPGPLPGGGEWSNAGSFSMGHPGTFLVASGFLVLVDGVHNIIRLPAAHAGRYVVRAKAPQASGGGALFAAFLPFSSLNEPAAVPGRGALKALAAIDKAVHLTVDSLPDACFAGDPVKIRATLTGAPVAVPVHLEVRVESRFRNGQSPTGETHFSEPVVRPASVTLTRQADGAYTGQFTPKEAALLRLGVSASGKTAAGKPYLVRFVSTPFTVEPLVAQLLSLKDAPMQTPGKTTLAGLKLTAQLDVLAPGEYSMSLDLGVPGGQGFPAADAKAMLAVGRQSLTAVVPAELLRSRLGNGPWEISNLHISRINQGHFVDLVAIPSRTWKTATYLRSQWDRGAAYTAETASATGIYPAASGRFRMIEVKWRVTTPGGHCDWGASLGMKDYVWMQTGLNGDLPAGQTTLSFFFDGSPAALAPRREWFFSPTLDCDSAPVSHDTSQDRMTLILDPQAFEPQATFAVDYRTVPSFPPNPDMQFVAIDVSAPGRVTVRQTANVPGIQLRLEDHRGEGPHSGVIDAHITIERRVAPGRYFLPLLVDSGTEHTATALVVQVVGH